MRYNALGKRKPKEKGDLINHFIKRVRQRYSIILSIEDVYGLVRQIKNNEAKFIFKQSNTRRVFEVTYFAYGKAIVLPVVYNNLLNMVCTVLPSDYEQNKSEYEDRWNNNKDL